MNRTETISAATATGESWDVIVIGGGATGLGSAVDAATRGHRTLLVEGADFGAGTSSRSTKLIHGGVRYLKQGRLGMVRQSLLERERLLQNAPHLVHPVSFVLPTFRPGELWYYFAGLRIYDMLAGSTAFAGARRLTRDEVIRRIPTLKSDGLRGGVLYADGQFDDARMAISLYRTLLQHGGLAFNYAPVVRLGQGSEGLKRVIVRDLESDRELTFSGRVVINATGVFADEILRLDHQATAKPESDDLADPQAVQIAPSQGTHLVLDRSYLPSDSGLMMPQTDDGRVLFAIPWHGHVLLGTTDTAVPRICREPQPLDSEVNYLLEHAGRYLRRQPGKADVRSMFAGLRPLVSRGAKTRLTSQLSREHQILTSDSGLITVIGGKWTTYRCMAEQVIDLAERVGSLDQRACRTRNLRLHGWSQPGPGEAGQLPAAANPLAVYGDDAPAIQSLMDERPNLRQTLHPRLPDVAAQVVWAARFEMARTVADVLARRTRALFLDAAAAIEAAPTVANLLTTELGRDPVWRDQQIAAFRALAAGYLATDVSERL